MKSVVYIIFNILVVAASMCRINALQIPFLSHVRENTSINMNLQLTRKNMNRRSYLASIMTAIVSAPSLIESAVAEEAEYENPNIPEGPTERSGLVVLRVAEVAQFQEKILRAVVNGDIRDFVVSPQQIVFGTKVLLKNSNIAGNMALMIETEVPRQKRKEARENAAKTMNTLQTIYTICDGIKRPFEKEEILQIADLYLKVRLQLNAMYEYLPLNERDQYYGYFMKVTEYEKKVAEGVYNPDIDGVLKFD